jgi:rhodanese-related sulfurtransferase
MSQLLQSRVMQNIPAANLQGVMMRMQEQEVKTGDMIITEGDEGDFYYLLHRGKALVLKYNEVSGEQVEVAKLGPGASFGEDALLSDSPRSSSIKMLSDGIVLKLAKDDFIQLVQHPLSETVNYNEATAIIEQGGIWLDVRSPEKYEQAHLEGAINMPYQTLRFQIPSLSDEHHYVIVSQSGRRGIASGFLFIERGFHVSILDGGYDKLPDGILDMPTDEAENESGNESENKPESGFGPNSEPVQETATPAESSPEISPQASASASTTAASVDSGELKVLNEKIQSLEAQLQEKSQQLEAAGSKISELEEALAARPASADSGGGSGGDSSSGDTEALKKEIVQLEREVITLTGQLESEEEGYDKLKQQFDTLTADHKKHLQVRDADIARLKEELTVLQLEKDQAESDYEDLEKQMQETSGESASNRVSELEALNASISQDRDDLRNDLEEARNQLSLANQENSELRLEISELKGRISELTES